MMRLLCSFLLAVASFSLFAQTTAAEAPTEHASMLTVVVFGVVFVASCVGVLWYMWWQSKKKGE
jgi:hypothetical protein